MSHDAPCDLSPLLFSHATAEASPSYPIVGPVEVSRQVVHGRGLVAARDIAAGEYLFVADPAARAPAAEVRRLWLRSGGGRSLEAVAEEVLLGEMRECLAAAGRAESFMMLFGEGEKEFGDRRDDLDEKDTLEALLSKRVSGTKWDRDISDKALLGIVRRNAFGPDYRNYGAMEETWGQQDKDVEDQPIVFKRILGLYPLAAIINHSCMPNAVRAFVRETMMVHASTPIRKGEEILWSYIPPTQTYRERQNQILSKYGFQCQCSRCQNEGSAFVADNDLEERLSSVHDLNKPNLAGLDSVWTKEDFSRRVNTMEEILKDSLLSNETRRYLRVGYTNLYINHFNMTLLGLPQNQLADVTSIREKILALATQLHFSFASCHNASTEHLSILHLCYELISFIHSSGGNPSSTIAKVRFWTDQLKRAHMVRYGSLGKNLEHVRQAMKHTRSVLRNLNGLQTAEWDFI